MTTRNRANDGALIVGLVLAGAVLLIGSKLIAPVPPVNPPQPVPVVPAPVPVIPAPVPQPAPAPLPPHGPIPPQNHAVVGEQNFPTGYAPNADGTKEYLQSLDKPTIREAGPQLFEDRKPLPVPAAVEKRSPIRDTKGTFLYRPFVRQYKVAYGRDWICDRQEIGDCVSFGYMHGVAMVLALDVELGHSERFEMPDTSGIYGGSRVEARGSPGDGARPYGGFGDGSYGAAATKFVVEWGVLFRRPYDQFDLTQYKGSRSKEWGAYGCGGKGDGGKADEIARQHPIKQAALVVSFEEAAKAIESGYPVPVCSGQGFSSVRDKDGFCSPRGSWSHCMCFTSVRRDRPGLLCQNSWGPDWVSGPKFPDDQPDGSFWVDEKTATSMLRGKDSFALTSIKGFPFRDLNNGEWLGSRESSAETHYALAP